ncbi:MAG: hypothetical protein LBL81_07050 [Tannerella sp.]|nr:hypothetical protein [Tannerella sp.]
MARKGMSLALGLGFLLCCPATAWAQTLIKGRVSGQESGHPLADIIVCLYEKGSPLMRAYGQTDATGHYELRYAGKADSLLLSVRGMNVREQSRMLPNRSQQANFSVREENLRIKEVVVKATPIRQSGDTLNYLVSHFATQADRSIGDVLKKLPGIDVSDDGTVLYQGKPINKYYIEGMDLLQGRYGIANNNLRAEDIATVQVLENYQPIRALKGIEPSERAAINLKLKASAKGIFMAELLLGIGLPATLRDDEALGMYFARKRQDLLEYKGNNTGEDVAKEAVRHYAEASDGLPDWSLLRLQAPAPPAVSSQRRLFNDAHFGSLNDTRKLSQTYTLTTNLQFLHDEDRSRSRSLSEYYLPGQEALRIAEDLDARLTDDKAEAGLLLETNTDRFYLSDKLELSADRKRQRGNVNRPDDSISQVLNSPDYAVSNTFDFVKRLGSKRYRLQSFLGYRRLSQDLAVNPLLYGGLFGIVDTQGASAIQNLRLHDFLTRNRAEFGIKGFSFRMDFNADLQNLNTRLYADKTGRPGQAAADSLQNRLDCNKYEVKASVSYFLDLGGHGYALALLPLRYLRQSDKDYLFAEPFLSAYYTLSHFWNLWMNYSYAEKTGDVREAYRGYVMLSYRNFFRNDGKVSKQGTHSLLLSLNYKNPFSALFGSLSATYKQTEKNLLEAYTFRGELQENSSVAKPNTSRLFRASANLGTDLTALRSQFSVAADYSLSHSFLLNENLLSAYTVNAFSVSPKFTASAGAFLVFKYRARYQWTKNKLGHSGQDLPLMRSFAQSGRADFLLGRRWSVYLSAEQFYDSGALEVGSRSAWFGDAGLKYSLKRVDFMLDGSNLFNTSWYVSTGHTDMERFYTLYKLRPAELLLSVRFNIR